MRQHGRGTLMTTPIYFQPVLFVLALVLFAQLSPRALGQSSSAERPVEFAEVEQAIRASYNAMASGDETAALNFIADGGFYYDVDGYVTNDVIKMNLRLTFRVEKAGTKYVIEPSDFKVTPISAEAAVANYTVLFRITQQGKEQTLNLRETDVLLKRNGRWQLLAEHQSTIPKRLERITTGLPLNWERGRQAASERYSMSVDSAVKHEGNASATIKFACGDSQDAWTSLGQPFVADELHGQRVRLTGWLKTADVDAAGIWMRVDTERHTLAIDDMGDRPAKGTTEWKMCSVVLDVPPEAKRIYIGAWIGGKGQVWVDDFKIEVVDKSVTVTNMLQPEDARVDNPQLANLVVPTRKHPINVGFEDGTVH